MLKLYLHMLSCFSRRRQVPLQYSCLENPMEGGAWWAAVHRVATSRTRLSDFAFTFHFHALEKEMATHSSVLENPRDRRVWWAAVYGIAQSQTRLKWLSSSTSSRFSYIWLSNTMDCWPPGSYVHEDSPGKNNEVGCHTFLQGIFPYLYIDTCLCMYKKWYKLLYDTNCLTQTLFRLSVTDVHIIYCNR